MLRSDDAEGEASCLLPRRTPFDLIFEAVGRTVSLDLALWRIEGVAGRVSGVQVRMDVSTAALVGELVVYIVLEGGMWPIQTSMAVTYLYHLVASKKS
jgi:hypothetical protein